MQPIFDMLMKFSRDLDRIGRGNVRIQRKGNQVQMSVPGTTLRCDYLAPWIKKNIKYGLIFDRHRIEYINVISDIYAKYQGDDNQLYFEVIRGVVRVYRLSPDFTSKVLINMIDLVPINGWIWVKLFCI